MFKMLGAVVALYTVFAACKGEVYAKHRAWGRTVSRADSPQYFWVVIAIYAGLSAALIMVF